MTREESDAARVMHFVWVLRDAFTAERDALERTCEWKALRQRWINILGLPSWAGDHGWWRHPKGSYRGDAGYVVHPCHRTIGWTKSGLDSRADAFGLSLRAGEVFRVLIATRMVMNTECDAFVQTPHRLIAIECKDKTSFSSEQRARQRRLFDCFERLLPRPQPLSYIEVSGETRDQDGTHLSWTALREMLE